MSATDAPRASTATPSTMQTSPASSQARCRTVDDVGVAPSLLGDLRVGSLLMAEARQRSVTRVFGVPRDGQSFLVTAILTGAAATAIWELVPRPWPRPSGADAAIGGAVLNATLGGIAGAPARNMPLAGALIGFAVLSHSVRPAVAGSARGARALAHEVRTALGARYWH